MAVLIILYLIHLAITLVVWFAGVALYNQLTGGPDLRQNPRFAWATALSTALVAVASCLPFPKGYFLTLVFWAAAPGLVMELPFDRGFRLFLILAAVSLLTTLALIGAGTL